MSDFDPNKKIKLMPLPYIGMFDLDLIYQASDVELLYQILAKVNEIAQSQNIIIDNFENILDWAQNQIEQYTKEQLQQWLNDGTLENMIMSLGRIVKYFDTTEEMLMDANLQAGQCVETLGYSVINDGGYGKFKIVDTLDDDNFQFSIGSNLYATLISPKNNALSYGMKNDGSTDNTTILNSIINKVNDLYFKEGIYKFNSAVTLKNINIVGENKNAILQFNYGINVLENCYFNNIRLESLLDHLFIAKRNSLTGNRLNLKVIDVSLRQNERTKSILYTETNNNYMYDVLFNNIDIYGIGKSFLETNLIQTSSTTSLTAMTFNNINILTGNYQHLVTTNKTGNVTGNIKGVVFSNIQFQYVIGSSNYVIDIDDFIDCVFSNLTVFDTENNIINIKSSHNSIYVIGCGSGQLGTSIKIPDGVELYNVIPMLISPSSHGNAVNIPMYTKVSSNRLIGLNRIPTIMPLGINDGTGDEEIINGVEIQRNNLIDNTKGFQFALNSVNRLVYRFVTSAGTTNTSWYKLISEYWFPYGKNTGRPLTPVTGYCYFDTTLNKPIWWNGSNWVDSTGTTV